MTEITRKDVARSIDWMGGFNSPIQFDEVDWSGAEAVLPSSSARPLSRTVPSTPTVNALTTTLSSRTPSTSRRSAKSKMASGIWAGGSLMGSQASTPPQGRDSPGPAAAVPSERQDGVRRGPLVR